jgi:endonuclease/exonuclease/phosphatase family metal-dependent hydrolase
MNDGGSEASELVPGVAYRELVGAVMRHRTEESFRNSAFFHAHGAALVRLLLAPRVDAPAEEEDGKGPGIAADRVDRVDRVDPGSVALPGAASLRVLQWNIEKGRELEGIIRRLREDPWMCRADLLLLNEVDRGTARGGNVDQARCLAAALGMHHAWLPTYIECTKGTGADLYAEGENTLGLHGLAILSRWPVTAARAVTLPSCHDYFDFHEKRFGGRRGLYTLITAGDRRLVAATTHLEVRRTPCCRARQFAAFLRGLDESLGAWAKDGLLDGGASGELSNEERGTRVVKRGLRNGESKAAAGIAASCIPVILGGDWNTNTFRRGSLSRSVLEFLRLVTTPAETLAAQLVAPFSREPLFALLAAEGFAVAPCNEAVPTVAQDLGSVEDLPALPASMARGVLRAFGLSGRVLRMRLDWIAVRGLQARGRPVTLSATGQDGRALSDHAAIGIDLIER